jgi:hypothetical protein
VLGADCRHIEVFEVEFIDYEGQSYAELALPADPLLVLHHRRMRAA